MGLVLNESKIKYWTIDFEADPNVDPSSRSQLNVTSKLDYGTFNSWSPPSQLQVGNTMKIQGTKRDASQAGFEGTITLTDATDSKVFIKLYWNINAYATSSSSISASLHGTGSDKYQIIQKDPLVWQDKDKMFTSGYFTAHHVIKQVKD